MRAIARGLFLTMLAGPAAAADMPQAMPSAPVAQTVFSWTGVYIGANGGYGQAAGSGTFTGLSGPLAGLVATSSTSGLSGALAGGQVGANWQTGALVLGAEGDYQWANIARTDTFGCGFACTISEKTALNGFGTIRGRVGAAFDRVLVYGTAGGAWITASDQASITVGALTGQLGKITMTGWGWTAGGGAEVAIDRNWSVKGEYLYLSTSKLSGTGAITALGTVRLDVNAHAHIGRFGVNYRF